MGAQLNCEAWDDLLATLADQMQSGLRFARPTVTRSMWSGLRGNLWARLANGLRDVVRWAASDCPEGSATWETT